jgi:hypothetical protein
MSTDLNLTGFKFNIAAAVFFVCLCVKFIPSNSDVPL